MRPLRVLHVIASLAPHGGGPAEGLRRHAAVRAGLGIQTTIAAFDDPHAGHEVPGARVVALGRGLGKYGFLPGAAARIHALAADHDVAVINGIWQYHALAAHRALAGHLPYAVFTHGMLAPWFRRTYPLKHLKKMLYWRMGDYRVLRDAAAVCFTTESERQLARNAFLPYVAREAVVGYGTSRPPPITASMRASFAAVCPQIAGRPYILFLSRIHEVKGCDLLISAFAAIAAARPELLLVVAGPDQDGCRVRLQAQAARAGIADRILWPGMLAGDAKWGAFLGAEVFCLPSHQESFGIAIAEALACGRPVLISDQVNIHHEIVTAGVGLAAPDTIEGTTGLLRTWIGLPAETREAMAARAQPCFDAHFEIHGAVDSLLALLNSLVAGDLPQPWSHHR